MSVARLWTWLTSLLVARVSSATVPREGSCVGWTSGPTTQCGSCPTTQSLVSWGYNMYGCRGTGRRGKEGKTEEARMEEGEGGEEGRGRGGEGEEAETE